MKINRNKSIPVPGQSLTALGLGFTNSDPVTLAQKLMKVSMNVISLQECVDRYTSPPPIVNNLTFCAMGLTQKGICTGDSGGPLLMRKGASSSSAGQDVQYGISSLGSRPCGERPSGFTRVSYFAKWIDANVCRFSHSKPTTTCAAPTTRRPTGKPTTVRKPSTKPVV